MTMPRLFAAVAVMACSAARVSTAAFEPTQLTLEFNAPNPQIAAMQLSQQLGFPVDFSYQRAAGGISYTGEKKPFALAFKSFLEDANFTCQDRGNRMGLTQGQPLRTIVIGDSVAVVIARANLYASSTRSGGGSVRYDLDTYIVYDPALQFAGIGRTVLVDGIETDGGRGTQADGYGYDPYGLAQTLSTWPGSQSTRISFSTPKPVKKLTKLSARVRAWQVAEASSVELPLEEFANGKTNEAKDLTVTASQGGNNNRNGQQTVTVTITGPAAERYRSGQWTQAMQKFVTLLDKEGKPLFSPNGYMNSSTANKGVSVTFYSNGQNNAFADVAGVSVKLPTKVRSVDVPIEITDLDLPGTD